MCSLFIGLSQVHKSWKALKTSCLNWTADLHISRQLYFLCKNNTLVYPSTSLIMFSVVFFLIPHLRRENQNSSKDESINFLWVLKIARRKIRFEITWVAATLSLIKGWKYQFLILDSENSSPCCSLGLDGVSFSQLCDFLYEFFVVAVTTCIQLSPLSAGPQNQLFFLLPCSAGLLL